MDEGVSYYTHISSYVYGKTIRLTVTAAKTTATPEPASEIQPGTPGVEFRKRCMQLE